jgi:hypothetical protein
MKCPGKYYSTVKNITMKTTYSFKGKIKLLCAAGLVLFCFVCNTNSYAQSVCISDNGATPDANAMLDVQSNTVKKGFLVPRLTLANQPSGSTGLLYYRTDNTPGFYYYPAGGPWTLLGSGGGSGWSLTGNSGTTTSTANIGTAITGGSNFLGTTDNHDLIFATSNATPTTYERMRITGTNGNIGIGNKSPDNSALLQIGTGTTNSQGLLIPQVQLTATNAAGPVSSPANGLLVFNTVTASAGSTIVNPGFYYWLSSVPAWVPILDNTPPNAGWMVTGNYGTNPATPNFMGTADAEDVAFRSNNTEIMRITSTNANVGIGTNSTDASSELDVSSTSKGLLIPNVALTATNAAAPITSPATSLLVYNTASTNNPPYSVSPGYYYNSGTPGSPLWVQLATSGSSSFQYENRFQTNGTCGASNYYFNSSNYGPGTYGDETNPYRNDQASGAYTTTTPGTVPAYYGVWYVSYTATATTAFCGYNGWGMIENNYNGTSNTSLLGGAPFTVTIYFYKYTPTAGNTGNITGTLCGSGTANISKTFVPASISFTCAPVTMAPGDILIGYATINGCPYINSTNYYSIIDIMGAMQFH